ncbi:hypothetical protein [Xanthomonas vesicatoria]|nr:hypothetical protein [Xanthomonas vesicatoria]
MNDITDIAATFSTSASNCAAANVRVHGVLAQPRFVRPASVRAAS